MSYSELYRRFGPAWEGLAVYEIDGVPHWVGCEVVSLLGLKNVTNSIRGLHANRKLFFPEFRLHMVPAINRTRSVYMLTFEGVITVIRRNRSRRCSELQAILNHVGM